MKELICIVCPKGCHLTVDEANNYAVTGNSCKRGEEYGKNEVLHPVRVLTSIVKVEGGTGACCSVKTNGAIPKQDIYKAMDLLKPVTVKAPIHMGDVVVSNICGTGVDWIATKNIKELAD